MKTNTGVKRGCKFGWFVGSLKCISSIYIQGRNMPHAEHTDC